MAKEIEVKLLNVNIDDIRNRLKQSGATLIKPIRLMRRVMIKTPEMAKCNAFLRVRDEGGKTTMTYKQFNSSSVDGCEEIETTVKDFDNAVEILKLSGLACESYQESKREEWKLNGAEIVIDEWPWLNPYIEIEGISEEQLKELSNTLGFDWQNAVFGSVTIAYNSQYPHLVKTGAQISDISEVIFGAEIPNILRKP